MFTYADSGEIRWPHAFTRLTIPGLASAQVEQPDATHLTEPPMGPLFPTGPAAPLANEARPSRVRELGDFDGDGARELGIAHYENGGLKQYLAAFTADRQLRGLVDADTGLGVQDVLSAGSQLADVNGDGRTDLVARHVVGSQRKLTVGVWTTTGILPDGTPVVDLETQRLSYVSENIGIGRIGPTAAAALPQPASVEAATDIPELPELMTGATNGLGDEATWLHLPLGAGLSVNGLAVASQPL